MCIKLNAILRDVHNNTAVELMSEFKALYNNLIQ